jgi:hypothetical protein
MIRELIDTELEVVAGGFLDFGNTSLSLNIAPQIGVAVGGTAVLGSIGGAAHVVNVGGLQGIQTSLGGH